VSQPDPRLSSLDLRESLVGLRELLVSRIADAEPKETAPLARQLSDVLVRLDGLPGEEKSKLDDLAARRDARRSAIPDSAVDGGVVGGS